MPELPEVETIRRTLAAVIVGKKIKAVEVRLPKVFQGEKAEIVGKTIEGIERRGKILIIKLSGNKSLLIHFKLTGQLVWVPEAGRQVTLGHPIPFAGTTLPAKTTHVIFEIDPSTNSGQAGRLFFNDLRQFGWIRVAEIGNWSASWRMEIGNLGPEPFDSEFTVGYLQNIFSKTAKPIKLVLMEQEKIAGIGNIYANEALFEAGIDSRRPAKKLGNEEIRKLRKAIIKVLNEGLKYGGSSAADEAYIKPTGEPGRYQEHFRVYQREGQKCQKCGGAIKRIDLGGRGTFFCPRCQR